MKFQKNQKVTIFDNKGIISDTTDAPEQYGVTFDATGKTYRNSKTNFGGLMSRSTTLKTSLRISTMTSTISKEK